MKIKNFFWFLNKQEQEVKTEGPESNGYDHYDHGNIIYGETWPILSKTWDGEKTLGELGVVYKNIPDYKRLRLRAYDAYVKTDIIKTITSKFFKWVVGSGLKLQYEPNKTVLEINGITNIPNDIQKIVEAKFALWAKSNDSDYCNANNLHGIALENFKSSFLGGDCLVICRFDELGLNIQLVLAEFIKNPPSDTKFEDEAKARGNTIEHGIELDKRGRHVAYFIKVKKDNDNDQTERIEAYNGNLKIAWLVYGQKITHDQRRGIPEISQILEKVNKLDRYVEATVGKAEQSAKITLAIEHDIYSTGENPLSKIVQQKSAISGSQLDGYAISDSLANKMQEQTSNLTYNMPNGARLKQFSSTVEKDFEQFYMAVFNGICASMDVPPEIAMQMYNSNYSASRAAINGWGFIVEIIREKNSVEQFYKPIFDLWLYYEVLQNKINLPGYILAVNNGNREVIQAYSTARFTGKNMPHIDPLKEVKAVREMLGDLESPLISYDQAGEMLGVGNWSENISKNIEEKKLVPQPKIDNQNNV